MIFDAHLHIIAPGFTLIPNQGYTPPWFTTDEYLPIAQSLGITGGAVVSGSFQAYDQTYLRDALSRLGPAFVGVTQLPREVSDETVLELAVSGVRAVRFNLRRGGSESVDAIEEMAWRVFDLARWHIEIYADAEELEPMVTDAELSAANRHRSSRTSRPEDSPRCLSWSSTERRLKPPALDGSRSTWPPP